MNPYPFVGLNHLTVPVAIMASLNEHYRAARPSCDRSSEISVVLGKRIQGCATSKARFEPENYTGSHDGFNSVRAAATRDKKLPFSLARCQLHRCPTGIRYRQALPISVPTLLNQTQDFGQRCRDRA